MGAFETRKTLAIKTFLQGATSPVAKWYNENMEVQVLVSPDGGERKSKTSPTGSHYVVYTDGLTEWKHVRIPLNADSNPTLIDGPIGFSLIKHAEGVGMTGWDFHNRATQWVGFDFDSIANHKAGISEGDMLEVMELMSKLPYVSILRSTSGKGLHIYLKMDKPFPTANHLEHAAVARSILTYLSAAIGYNFQAKVDCVGSILWVWHRKQEGTNGLTWVKEAEKDFDSSKVPPNWKDHLSVVSKKRSSVHLKQNQYEVSSSIPTCPLEKGHKKILAWFTEKAELDWWWDSDHHMLVCHTLDLKRCHEELGLRGLFETNSSGSSRQNCFAFPSKMGVFTVRRHGLGVQEHASWVTDEKGWTKTLFNEVPGFVKAMRFFGGLEDRRGSYVFPSIEHLSVPLAKIGIGIVYPESFRLLKTVVSHNRREGRICVTVESNPLGPIEGWISLKGGYEKVFPYVEEEVGNLQELSIDSNVRVLVNETALEGWFLKSAGNWLYSPRGEVGSVIQSMYPDLTTKEVSVVMGNALREPWSRTTKPFGEEYPGGRMWNKSAACYSTLPEDGPAPTWDALLEHIGKGLDEPVKNDLWCRQNGILTGADYIFMWIANMLKETERPLPYLFMWGGQNTGKSTLHEALSILFKDKKGYVNAAQALKGSSFNGELEGAVLCFIEEVNLSDQSSRTYDKMKEWVTAREIFIRPLYKDGYMVRNYCKFIQMANDAMYLPVYEGDTRVTAWEVFKLEAEIPKDLLMDRLKKEAASFLGRCLNTHLPEPYGRLAIPALASEEKKMLQEANRSPLEEFLATKCTLAEGAKTSYSVFFDAYQNYLENRKLTKVLEKATRNAVKMKLPKVAPMVFGTIKGVQHLGNLFISDGYEKDDIDAEMEEARANGVWVLAPNNELKLKKE